MVWAFLAQVYLMDGKTLHRLYNHIGSSFDWSSDWGIRLFPHFDGTVASSCLYGMELPSPPKDGASSRWIGHALRLTGSTFIRWRNLWFWNFASNSPAHIVRHSLVSFPANDKICRLIILRWSLCLQFRPSCSRHLNSVDLSGRIWTGTVSSGWIDIDAAEWTILEIPRRISRPRASIQESIKQWNVSGCLSWLSNDPNYFFLPLKWSRLFIIPRQAGGRLRSIHLYVSVFTYSGALRAPP